MHHILCTTVVALLGVCSVPALATSEGAATQRVEITAARDPVAAARSVLALPGEHTHYEMSNGRNLVVTAYGDHVEMRYGRRAAKLLRHDGQGNFVSRDGSLALQFELDARGVARLAHLSAPASWF